MLEDAAGSRGCHHGLGPRLRGFTAKYDVNRLVWYEVHDTREAAKSCERRIKKWKRAWKIRLIEETNPGWLDLYETWNC
ncbi:MAG TPA: hypothetical protein PLO65_03665 [Caulobacter sp.]|nr:hypothetical protein [Caulobacter sp.]